MYLGLPFLGGNPTCVYGQNVWNQTLFVYIVSSCPSSNPPQNSIELSKWGSGRLPGTIWYLFLLPTLRTMNQREDVHHWWRLPELATCKLCSFSSRKVQLRLLTAPLCLFASFIFVYLSTVYMCIASACTAVSVVCSCVQWDLAYPNLKYMYPTARIIWSWLLHVHSI